METTVVGGDSSSIARGETRARTRSPPDSDGIAAVSSRASCPNVGFVISAIVERAYIRIFIYDSGNGVGATQRPLPSPGLAGGGGPGGEVLPRPRRQDAASDPRARRRGRTLRRGIGRCPRRAPAQDLEPSRLPSVVRLRPHEAR